MTPNFSVLLFWHSHGRLLTFDVYLLDHIEISFHLCALMHSSKTTRRTVDEINWKLCGLARF